MAALQNGNAFQVLPIIRAANGNARRKNAVGQVADLPEF
jgi:hypothetical protein